MRIKINHNKCTGCGRCVAMHPDIFRLNDASEIEVIKQPDNPEDIISICYFNAIENEEN